MFGQKIPLPVIKTGVFLAYPNFLQRVDTFSGLLFYFGLLPFLLMLPKLFCKGVPFGTGWWAISFPIAALTSASLKYATYTEAWPVTAIAIILLSTLSMPILVFLIKTLPVLLNGNLFIA